MLFSFALAYINAVEEIVMHFALAINQVLFKGNKPMLKFETSNNFIKAEIYEKMRDIFDNMNLIFK